jgi:hypothetical protein
MTKTAESFVSGGMSVPIETFVPDASPQHRAVLVLHGSLGLGPPYRTDIVSFAEALEAYPGQGHRFVGAALTDARATTVDFIDSRL